MVIRVVGVIAASVGTAIALLFVNGIYLFNKFKAYLPDLNNRPFWGIVRGIYDVLPGSHKISLLAQFVVLILTTIGVLIFTIKQKTKPILSKATFIKTTNKTNSGTDLDTLYKMLLSKKEISVGDIETAFKVSNEVAMEWCKVLENADLAIMDYPTFKKPILRVPEEEKKEEDIEESVKKAREKSDEKSKSKAVHFKRAKHPVVKIKKTKIPRKNKPKKKGEVDKPKAKKKIKKKEVSAKAKKKSPNKKVRKTKKKS